jgi:hypothetical protein
MNEFEPKVKEVNVIVSIEPLPSSKPPVTKTGKFVFTTHFVSNGKAALVEKACKFRKTMDVTAALENPRNSKLKVVSLLLRYWDKTKKGDERGPYTAPKLMPTVKRSALEDKKPSEELTPLVEDEPKARPFSVICTDVDAAIAADAVVITIAVNDGADDVPFVAPLILTVGVAAVLKKPEGYVNVIKLPTARPPPTVVVKLNVAATFILPAKRSMFIIAKDADNICPPMTPEALPTEAKTSEVVDNVIPVILPPFAAPIVKPLRVMVNDVVEAMPTTAVVMTMELPVMADVAVMVAAFVEPAALAKGFGVAAKKPAG